LNISTPVRNYSSSLFPLLVFFIQFKRDPFRLFPPSQIVLHFAALQSPTFSPSLTRWSLPPQLLRPRGTAVFPIGPHTRCSFPQSLRINLGHPSYLFESVSQPVSRWYCGFHLDIRTPPPLVTSPPPAAAVPGGVQPHSGQNGLAGGTFLFGWFHFYLAHRLSDYILIRLNIFPLMFFSFFEVYAYLACSFVRPWVYFNFIYSEHPPQIKEVGRFYHTRDQLT